MAKRAKRTSSSDAIFRNNSLPAEWRPMWFYSHACTQFQVFPERRVARGNRGACQIKAFGLIKNDFGNINHLVVSFLEKNTV